MKRLIAASLIMLAGTAGCQSQTRVVRDGTVGSKFAAFGKSGWGVSGGGLENERTAVQQRGAIRYSSNGPTPFGPSEIKWSTNFQTDEPAPAAPPPPPPAPSTIDPMTGQPLAH